MEAYHDQKSKLKIGFILRAGKPGIKFKAPAFFNLIDFFFSLNNICMYCTTLFDSLLIKNIVGCLILNLSSQILTENASANTKNI